MCEIPGEALLAPVHGLHSGGAPRGGCVRSRGAGAGAHRTHSGTQPRRGAHRPCPAGPALCLTRHRPLLTLLPSTLSGSPVLRPPTSAAGTTAHPRRGRGGGERASPGVAEMSPLPWAERGGPLGGLGITLREETVSAGEFGTQLRGLRGRASLREGRWHLARKAAAGEPNRGGGGTRTRLAQSARLAAGAQSGSGVQRVSETLTTASRCSGLSGKGQRGARPPR